MKGVAFGANHSFEDEPVGLYGRCGVTFDLRYLRT